jgi:hypothetical protein
MLKLSNAPIPADTLGLADAFKQVCEHRISDWQKIISQIEASSAELESRYAAMGLRLKLKEAKAKGSKVSASDFGHDQYSRPSSREALDALDAATIDDFSLEQKEVIRIGAENDALALRLHWRKVEADRIMREALASGALVAKIENPRTGEPRPLNNISRWLPPNGSDYEPGFRSDYVEPWHINKPMPDQPGPPTDFDDSALHRVFFDQTEFNDWLSGTSSPAGFTIVHEDKLTTTRLKNISRALKHEFRGDAVPRLKIPEIIKRIKDDYRKRMEVDRHPDKGGPAEATVRRVLGLENSAQK